jgi:hypothetical protein
MRRARSPVQLAFAKLVGGIVLLDAVAIAAFELGHVADRGAVFLQRYVIGWTVASALVAAWGLWHVKRARRDWRRARMAEHDGGSGPARHD